MSGQKPASSADVPASTLLPRVEVIAFPGNKPRGVPSAAFSKLSVAKMRCPAGQSEKFFWDSKHRGFGLRALSSGRRSWIYQYRDEHGRTRRIAFGDVSTVPLEDARDAVRKAAARVACGDNPSVDRRKKRNAGTVSQIIDAYLPYAEERQRRRTYKETKRHLRLHAAPLHHERVETVNQREVSDLLERITRDSGPVAANRVRATLRAVWIWGLRTGRIEGERNPVAFTVRNPERARERVLDDRELKAIWYNTSDGNDYSRIVRLCLLTGCRRQEIGGLRWSEILADRITIDAGRMKGKEAHEIALLPWIAGNLPSPSANGGGAVFGKNDAGFSGFRKCKAKLDTAIAADGLKMAPWGLHDLRRTCSTRLHDAGVEPWTIEALLAHKQQGIARVYNRASFWKAKRAALARWHKILTSIVVPAHITTR
jgi:integrase